LLVIKLLVAKQLMPQEAAFFHPHCEKCGLAAVMLGLVVWAAR
jgi:hypothetical protein